MSNNQKVLHGEVCSIEFWELFIHQTSCTLPNKFCQPTKCTLKRSHLNSNPYGACGIASSGLGNSWVLQGIPHYSTVFMQRFIAFWFCVPSFFLTVNKSITCQKRGSMHAMQTCHNAILTIIWNLPQQFLTWYWHNSLGTNLFCYVVCKICTSNISNMHWCLSVYVPSELQL